MEHTDYIQEQHRELLRRSDLFSGIRRPAMQLIRSMVFDTFVALTILIAYFYTVLDLTTIHFSQLWVSIAVVVIAAMILQVLLVFLLSRSTVGFLRRVIGDHPVRSHEVSLVFQNLKSLPLNLSSSGLLCWSIGIIISSYWLRLNIDLTPEKVSMMIMGGVLAAVGTNAFAYFRVRNMVRPYLVVIGQVLDRDSFRAPRPVLYRELLLTFLLLVSFSLAMSSIFHFSLTLKLITIAETDDPQRISQLIDGYIDQTGLMILVLCVLSLALAIGLASSAARNITEPLMILSRRATTITAGNLDQELPYLASDEVGMLAREFETMRLSLKKSLNEKERMLEELAEKNRQLAARIIDLEKLDVASRTFSSSIDYDHIVTNVLDSFMTAVEVSHGSLYLFDQESSSLVLSRSGGLTPTEDKIVLSKRELEWIESRPFPLTLETFEREIRTEETLVKWRSLWSSYELSLAIPLFIEGKPIGFIILGQKRDGREIQESELKLLTTLANQASIAINNARLYEQATVDSLTKLYLRRYFQHRLREEIWRVRRYGHDLSVVMMDIDHFKSFNDTYGHLQGDRVLQHVGLTIRNLSRETDIPARYGGEEFIILLPDTTLIGAERIAERLRATISERSIALPEGADTLIITVSAGVAVCDDTDEADGLSLIRKADTALYQAKRSGRNKTSVYRKHHTDPD